MGRKERRDGRRGRRGKGKKRTEGRGDGERKRGEERTEREGEGGGPTERGPLWESPRGERSSPSPSLPPLDSATPRIKVQDTQFPPPLPPPPTPRGEEGSGSTCIRAHTCTHAHVHTNAATHARTRSHTCSQICVYVHLHVHPHAYPTTHMRVRVQTAALMRAGRRPGGNSRTHVHTPALRPFFPLSAPPSVYASCGRAPRGLRAESLAPAGSTARTQPWAAASGAPPHASAAGQVSVCLRLSACLFSMLSVGPCVPFCSPLASSPCHGCQLVNDDDNDNNIDHHVLCCYYCYYCCLGIAASLSL